MKFALVFVATILLTTAIVSANNGNDGVQCGNQRCGNDQVCHIRNGDCNCVSDHQVEASLRFNRIGSWTRDGRQYTQFDVTITNHSNRNIRQINIRTDETFTLRSQNDLWNMVRQGDNLSLPSTQTINSGASYTFGFIIVGTQQPNLRIRSIVFN
ncbi:cellulose-binding domain-containing protein [Tieghemostelium lacteum]|uniref:Cellulose-binding domain-containing protein n=1 Tax=Tieghemostelium lacteum TaxID=361077 RepID=A0A152A9U3_TIELA|nr:cellulose-binding domain-containing protein [Tieghemostelium lacteum]|eukprot:KYR02993.1 cellulose-binding domain-containing protein [Tieghemostelium lacteum]